MATKKGKARAVVVPTVRPPAGMPSAGATNPGKALSQELAQIMGLNRLRTMRGRQGQAQPS